MYKSYDFAQVLNANNSNRVYETLRKVILTDDELDDKARVQKLVALMHSYSKVNSNANIKLS